MAWPFPDESVVEITFDAFKEQLTAKYGADRIRFRETGKDGWTSLEQLPERLVHGQPGPHWCDASLVNPQSQWLASNYDFKTGKATLYEHATRRKND